MLLVFMENDTLTQIHITLLQKQKVINERKVALQKISFSLLKRLNFLNRIYYLLLTAL